MQPLVEEAMKKAAIAWIRVPTGGRPYPLWCLWLDGALYVVSGPGEQPAPGLADAATAEVATRGDHGGRIVTWPATVSRLDPAGDDWDRVATQLAAKRLNAPGTAAATVARWATDCVVSQLTPAGDPTEARPDMSDASGAAPPPPTPATTRATKPFKLHRVRGEKRHQQANE